MNSFIKTIQVLLGVSFCLNLNNHITDDYSDESILSAISQSPETKEALADFGMLSFSNNLLPDTNANWMASMQQDIQQREYHISYDSSENSFQCPNRKNNIRSYFKPGEFTMQNRIDSVGYNWMVKLTNEGIYADDSIIAYPQTDAVLMAAYNELSIQHNIFKEQYINTEEGVRQNFIIDSAPENTKELKVKLKSEGLDVERVHPLELHFYRQCENKTENVITYSDLKVWDANNKKLEASFEVTGNEIAIIVNAVNAQYPITIDPISTTAAAMVESNQAGARLGCSVASAGDVNGDGYSDVIVGAYLYDNGQTNEGAAFVYHGSATGISTNATAMVESNQANANLGISVASAGDVNGDGYSDVIVGAHLYDNGQTNEGAAFVYHGAAGGISTIAPTRVESNQANAEFGYSVASAGDVNGDGYSDVIVGAHLYDNVEADEGAAFVYHGSATGISTNATAMVESNQANAYLGISVASAGDVNGDGYSDVIVGAYWYDNGQTNEGAAFVYHGAAGGISTIAPTRVESNQANAEFGYSVASAGDVNGDGYSDVIVGAWLYDNVEADEGAAFVYHGSATGISTTAAAMVESNQASALFGYSVASAGDVNGDGYSDVIVGAYFYDNGQTNEGAAFVYHGSASGISTNATAMVESNQANAYFGYSVASAGDVNGDGYSDVIVGAILYDNGQTDEGAAFVYHGSAAGISTTAAAMVESNQASALFGYSVASAGDVNGDGYSDVIVGAYAFDNGQTDEGAAFVYHGSAAGISTTAAALVESNQATAYFGQSVASAGDVNGDGYSDVIVGAILYDNGQTDEGAAFVYHGSAAGISNTAAALAESNQAAPFFGGSVASAGDVNGDGYSDVIVGARVYDNGQTDEGAAFVYHGSAAGISTSAAAQLECNQTSSYFGQSVASAGDVNGDGYSDVIVGAYFYDNGQADEGAAFVYHGSASGISTIAASRVESNQVSAWFGTTVASAGDVNGDGYSDVIVGARLYDNGQADEGAAFVYHGSAGGISTTAATQVESNQANAQFGLSVASAGDVNGDGYSDAIVGSHVFDNGQADEGAAFVYHGSASGIGTTAAALVESNQASAYFGLKVASAGDVNGDGYSDVIVGAYAFDNGQVDEGAAFVYLGNEVNGKRNNLRLYNSNLTSIINQSNVIDDEFGTGFYAKSFLGRNKGKLIIEAKKDGQGFSKASNNSITNSVQSTRAQANFSNLGTAGTELKSLVTKVASLSTKVRVRVKYDPVLAITGQMYGPWRYMPGYLITHS